MAGLLTPRRRYGSEFFDVPSDNQQLVLRTVADIKLSNVVFRGARAAVAELALYFPQLPESATLLDVGTGMGDVPRDAASAAERYGIALTTIGLDVNVVLAQTAASSLSYGVCGNGTTLPFGDASVDIVMCSQTLHHFRGAGETALLREMNRVARVAVVVSDLRRSWLAAAGFWLASFPLGFHRVTRHDGVLSVLRGYTPSELATVVSRAVGVRPSIHKRLGFRMTTSWVPVPGTPTGVRG
jgi:2-polyprenyl-3-methyl-5-hydroxy-6-metoxy-1,4-benzoquinol methylase